MVCWTALTPALSPRRGRIVRSLLASLETGIGRVMLEQTRVDNCCSLSLGERVRVKAGVPTLQKKGRASLRRLLRNRNEPFFDVIGNFGGGTRTGAAAGGFVAASGAQAGAWLFCGGGFGAALPEHFYRPLQLQFGGWTFEQHCGWNVYSGRLVGFLQTILPAGGSFGFDSRGGIFRSNRGGRFGVLLADCVCAGGNAVRRVVKRLRDAVRFYRTHHDHVLRADEFSARAARVAGGRHKVFDPRCAVVGVHGLWHRVGLGKQPPIQFQRTRRLLVETP